LLVLFGALYALAQPVVNSAVNAASYLTPPSPGNSPIAQGSIFVVFGTGMGPAGLVQATAFPLTTALSGTSVSVVSGGKTVSALMVYTSAAQVAAILPSSTPAGAATFTVTYNAQISKAININVTKSVPGMFTLNAQGNGPGAAQVAFSGTDVRLNNLTTPAGPGAVMILYGTGLGPITRDDSTPPGVVSTGGNVTVTVGGKVATVLYAGRAPQFPGEDQINIQLPADVPLGCYTPAVVAVNGIPSNDFVLSTAAAGSTSCVHPFGLNQAAEAAVDAGGTANVGVFAAIRGAASGFTAEGAGGLFENANAAQLWATYSAIIANFHVTYYPAPAGGCAVYDQLSLPSGLPIPDFTTIGSKELRPGLFLTLKGPNALHNIIAAGNGTPGSGFLWFSIGPDYILGPGQWTLSSAGGPDVAAFSATTEFPTNLTWTNMGSLLTPPRSTGVTITWTGSGTAAQSNVNIFGNSSVFNNTDPSQNRGTSFSCIVPANASPFAVPATITQKLPVAGAGEVANGSLGISIGGGSQFNAALANGQPLDGSFFGFGEAFVNTGITWK